MAADAGTEIATAVWASGTRTLTASSDPTAAAIADAVWDEATTGHTTAGTFGEQVKTDIDAILVDTTEIGAAGAGLTAVPWNAAWDAEVESECTDALNAYDPPTNAELSAAVANVSVDEIQASALADLFNTDSGTTYAAAVAGSPVKEIADNAGGSSLTEAGIADAVWDEALAGHTGAGSAGEALSAAGSGADAAAIADAVWDEATTGHTTAGTFGEQVKTDIDAILADTGTDGVVVASIAAGAVNAAAIADGAIDAATFAAGAIDAAAIADNAIDAGAIAADAITAGKIAADAIGSSELAATAASEIATAVWAGITTAAAQTIADELLKRGIANVEDTADTTSLAALVLAAFESAVSGTTWTIRKTSGTTFATKTVTTDANADPIVGVT